MTFSIITATFNSSATVRDTLESVASQDYKAVEHIIIDGLSKDQTLSIVKEFEHVSAIFSEGDKGIYDAMNKGINKCGGDIVGILNSDDFYFDNHVLSRVAEVFERTGCDAVYGDLIYIDQVNTSKVIRYWKSGSYRPGSFKWGWMPPHPTFFVKRELYEKWGSFNLQLKTSADYELMLRLIHKYKIKLEYIPSVLVKMRMGGVSNISLSNRLRANKEDKLAWAINNLRPFWFTLYLKPLKKITQFIKP
jgi:glycosyltransferase involved in cell wall biosynthesis